MGKNGGRERERKSDDIYECSHVFYERDLHKIGYL